MRNYFDFRLKGSQIFPYVIIGWVVVMAIVTLSSLPAIRMAASGTLPAPSERVLDGSFVWSSLASLGLSFLQGIVTMGVMFFIVKATVNGFSLGEERPEADYDFGRYIWIVVKGLFFSIITFGIYAPWFVARVVRYFAENTIFRSKAFSFKGKGGTLFGIIVLTVVLPVFLAVIGLVIFGISVAAGGPSLGILWIFITIFALIFLLSLSMALTLKWFFDFTFGTKRIASEMKIVPSAFYIMGQVFLVMITLGLYVPMYTLRIYRYFLGRMVLGDKIVATVKDAIPGSNTLAGAGIAYDNNHRHILVVGLCESIHSLVNPLLCRVGGRAADTYARQG